MASHPSFTRATGAFLCTALLSANVLLAQDPCDSLEIVSLSYAPFSDTSLQVVVQNNGTDFFSHPRFWLVNEDGDTLAREELNFFGLGPGEQNHRMDLVPGATLPATPFTGTLVLFYSTGGGDAFCTFPITTELCPPACVPLQVYLYSLFGSATTSSFPWQVSDSTGAIMGTGTLDIDIDSLQQDLDSLCLQPGAYTLHIEQPIASGMEFQYGLTQDGFVTNGPFAILPAGGSMDFAFDYYPACIGLGMGLPEAAADAPLFALDGRLLTITDARHRALGEVVLYDATGRRILRVLAPSSSITLDLSDRATGMHLVSTGPTGGIAHRIMVP